MIKPLASIVWLNYDSKNKVVLEGLQSTFELYSNVEFIVVDDRSTDGSFGIIKKFIEERGLAT